MPIGRRREVVISDRNFRNAFVITYPENNCDSRALPDPLGTTSVPLLPTTSALFVPGERVEAEARLAERGPWRSVLPRTGGLTREASGRRIVEQWKSQRDAGVNSACTIDNESAAAVNTAELLQHVVGG